MTHDREFDRLAKAWLDLGPDEAPDRVVVAVLRAAQSTPQVRRRFGVAIWRPFAVAAAVVVAIVVIGGGLLLTQRNQPLVGGPPASPSVAPSSSLEPSPSPSAPPSSAATIVLQRSPTNLGCDSLDPGWRSATIRIDPESDVYLEIVNPAFDGTRAKVNVDVWAEVDPQPSGSPDPAVVEPLPAGTRLAVYWPASFTVRNGDTPVILGARGEEVGRDGTTSAQLDKLTGVFICASREAIWVLDYQPQ